MLSKKVLQDIEDVIKIQKYDGNWNHDSYMHGMLNGMLMIEGIVKGVRDIKFYSAPKRWKYERWYERLWRKITRKDQPIREEK